MIDYLTQNQFLNDSIECLKLIWCFSNIECFDVVSSNFLSEEKNRKWILFSKAIYAHKLVDLFCCCGFECKREDEEKEEKLNIQFIFRLSVPPHIWKQDRKNTTCVLDSLLILHFKHILLFTNVKFFDTDTSNIIIARSGIQFWHSIHESCVLKF